MMYHGVFHCFPKVKLRQCTELECASPPFWREVRVDMDRMVAWNERATATNPKARFFPKKITWIGHFWGLEDDDFWVLFEKDGKL